MVSAESSIVFRLFSFAKLYISSQLATFPMRLGTHIADTPSSGILFRTDVSICIVSLSTSINKGIRPL